MKRTLIAAVLALICATTVTVAQQTMSTEQRDALAAAEQPLPIRDGLEGPWGVRVFAADGVRFGNFNIDSVSADAFTGRLMSEPAGDATLRVQDAAVVLTWSTGRTYVTDPDAGRTQDGVRRTHVARFRGHRIDGESMDEHGVVIARWYALRPEDESDAPARFAGRSFEVRPVGVRARQCIDRYDFSADGTLTVTSGEEVLQTRWRILPRRVGPDLVLERTLVRGNGNADCSGNVSSAQPGSVRRIYVMFRNDGSAVFCSPPFPRDAIIDCYANLVPVH